MRIAYLTDINLGIDSGVQKKHLMQASCWRQQGHAVKIFSIPAEWSPNSAKLSEDDIMVFDSPLAKIKSKGLSVYLRKIFTVNQVIKALKDFKPDVVYAREVLWYPGLNRIIKNFPVIWEANTLLLKEVSLVSHPLVKKANRIFIPKLYKNLKGVVAVTHEIGDLFKPYNIPVEVVANGIDFSKFPDPSRAADDVEKINVLFVGSPGMEWHGTEHFCEMASLTPFADFHLVGPVHKNEQMISNLHQYGYMQTGELQQLYKKMDIAVGSLGLYLKGMHEACPLKVREYCAMGLPTIMGYKDTDLHGADFILEIDNNPQGVKSSIREIHHFIHKWKGKRINRENAISYLDTGKKEIIRLNFMKSIAKKYSKSS